MSLGLLTCAVTSQSAGRPEACVDAAATSWIVRGAHDGETKPPRWPTPRRRRDGSVYHPVVTQHAAQSRIHAGIFPAGSQSAPSVVSSAVRSFTCEVDTLFRRGLLRRRVAARRGHDVDILWRWRRPKYDFSREDFGAAAGYPRLPVVAFPALVVAPARPRSRRDGQPSPSRVCFRDATDSPSAAFAT